jgi:hypothetical protein
MVAASLRPRRLLNDRNGIIRTFVQCSFGWRRRNLCRRRGKAGYRRRHWRYLSYVILVDIILAVGCTGIGSFGSFIRSSSSMLSGVHVAERGSRGGYDRICQSR